MKNKITITYKNKKTENYDFKEIVMSGEGIEIVCNKDGDTPHGAYIRFNVIKEINIK